MDEFLQSPLEFLIHDLNHAWKMMDMDDQFLKANGDITRKELMENSSRFIGEYFPRIALEKGENEELREIKKLKKIILFEVGHEDARPLLPGVIGRALLEEEGYPFPDIAVIVDRETGPYLKKSMISGITALAYVRHKLQHGFFDQTDAQNSQIVHPSYRSVDWIVRAATEILSETNTLIPDAVKKE